MARKKKVKMELLPEELWAFQKFDYDRDITKLKIANLKAQQDKKVLEKRISEQAYQISGLEILQHLDKLNKQKEKYLLYKQTICDRLQLKDTNLSTIPRPVT